MRVRVKTPARLHLGLLDINGDLGRLYGSIGVAIERPNVLLEAELLGEMSAPGAPAWEVEGLETERVATFASRFLERYPLPYRVRLRLLAAIPAHVGLGSGTQLALAVGTALARLGGLRLSVPEIALAVRRGVHSGIGIAAFQGGGFILDGGHRVTPTDPATQERRLPPILVQHPFPEQWYFVVVVPQISPGFSGERERSAFETLPQAPAAAAERISRLLLIKMLPALIERDILAFGQALTAIQQLVGDCFAAVQGGRYAHSLSEELIGFMLEQGAAGAGQSSWGPTVYGLVEGEEAARLLAEAVRAFLASQDEGQTLIVRAANHGAQVRVYR